MTSISFGSDSIIYVHNDSGNRIRWSPSKCRAGCPTQDHKSYADCARGIQVNTGLSLSTGQKKQDAELRAYKRAREQGVQPLGTQMHQVEQAMKMSDATGVAFGG